MADASHLTTSHPRQKRVLPTRSRRGGPGVGSCDVDLMILDAQKRRRSYLPGLLGPCRFTLIINYSRQRATHSRRHTFLVDNKLGTAPALIKVCELWAQYFCQSALLRPVRCYKGLSGAVDYPDARVFSVVGGRNRWRAFQASVIGRGTHIQVLYGV